MDHVGWNTILQDGRWLPTFPNAKYLFAREEFEHWSAEVEAGRGTHDTTDEAVMADSIQVILPTAPGVSNEGPSSRLLVLVPAVSWPWVLAWGSLEPPRRDGENAQKRGKTGKKWARCGLKRVKEGS